MEKNCFDVVSANAKRPFYEGRLSEFRAGCEQAWNCGSPKFLNREYMQGFNMTKNYILLMKMEGRAL